MRDNFLELHLNCSACVDNVFEISETSAETDTYIYSRHTGRGRGESVESTSGNEKQNTQSLSM